MLRRHQAVGCGQRGAPRFTSSSGGAPVSNRPAAVKSGGGHDPGLGLHQYVRDGHALQGGGNTVEH